METSPIPPPEFQERSRVTIDDSITDARSTRSRIAEILNRAGVRGKSREAEMVRRLTARYQFSG